jgi:hypothetical protein
VLSLLGLQTTLIYLSYVRCDLFAQLLEGSLDRTFSQYYIEMAFLKCFMYNTTIQLFIYLFNNASVTSELIQRRMRRKEYCELLLTRILKRTVLQ